MAKKKDKPQVINNIQELNLEIDYKKLAKEIVAVQEETKKLQKCPSRFRAAAMAAANTMIPILLALFAALACVGMWVEFANNPMHELSTYIGNTALFLAIAIVSVCCGVEAWRDDDDNAIQHFNTNIAMIALGISLLALLKGVG